MVRKRNTHLGSFSSPRALFHCSIWIQGGGTKPPRPHPILRSPNATDLHFAPAAKTRVAFWRFHGLRHDGWGTPLLRRREFGNPRGPATPLNFYSSPCQKSDLNWAWRRLEAIFQTILFRQHWGGPWEKVSKLSTHLPIWCGLSNKAKRFRQVLGRLAWFSLTLPVLSFHISWLVSYQSSPTLGSEHGFWCPNPGLPVMGSEGLTACLLHPIHLDSEIQMFDVFWCWDGGLQGGAF